MSALSRSFSRLTRPRIGPILQAWAQLDAQSRLFALALVASVVFHAVVLSIRFQMPEVRRDSVAPLEVVIVNSRSRTRPDRPQVLAQANLNGGGETEQPHRARAPLPNQARNRAGNDIEEAKRRVQELEERQRQLLTQSHAPAAAPASIAAAAPAEPQRDASGAELRDSAMAMVRSMEAQVSRQIDEYNRRPRKTFVGARASEFRFAQYVEDWRQKIERIGNLNYPESARGRTYGSLRLSVSINADGSLGGLELERSSGYPVLDRAAERIVQMAAPFARFPSDIRRDTDILVITRTWHFAPGDRVFSD